MVRLTVSPDVSRSVSTDAPTTNGGALTTITVQAGKAKIELAVLKHQDKWQVRIRQLIPDLTEVGENVEQAKALRQEHDDLVSKLGAKQREFAAVLTKTPKAGSEDGTQEVSIQSLSDAWKDVNKQMEYRRMLLDQSVAFHTSAQQFANKLDQVESQCTSDVQSHDIDTVRRLLQQHQDLKKGVLEASMSTLQEGQALLERIRKVALCAGVQTRHATTSACHAIERLLQLLQDKWRRLEELWYRRWIQLQQGVQLAQVDQDAAKVRSWLDTVGEAYIGKRELGDSLDSAYSLQEECLGIESQFLELPVTMRRLVDTAEYLVHSTLPKEGECGAVRQRLTALLRRVEDFGKMFAVRRKNVTQAAQFFSLAQVATVKLQEIENQLSRHDMTDRHGYLASAVIDISAVALHCGRTLMARIGPNIPTAKGIETTLAALEEKSLKLQAACTARYGKKDKLNESLVKLLDNVHKFNSWLTQVAEAVISVNFDTGSNLLTAQDFLDLHQNLVNDLKVKQTEIKTLDRVVTEVASSGVEADVAGSKDAAEKLKNLNEQYTKLNAVAEQRLKLATDLVAFHKRVQQLTTQMDLLELHLKLEKLDPAQVPDSSIAHKNEAFKKMNAEWTEVEAKGKQFVADCSTQSSAEDRFDLERTTGSVEFLLAHLSDRKAILTDFVERWNVHVNSGKEFKTQWQQFVKDARQTIDWITKVENDFFPEIAGELGNNMAQVKHHQKRLEDFKPNILKAKEDVEKHLKTVELLSLKGDSHGQRDQIVNELLKVHTRFLARIGEYRFLLNMSEKFFENLDQLDDLIKKTEKAYAAEELPKEVEAAQKALREHYDSRAGLQQFINFASEEADEIIVRVRQQDSEALARDEVQRVLQAAEEKRNAWDKAWQDQKTRLDQNFQACQFYFDLKQLQSLLDELQRQLDMRRGNYGNSLSSAEMIVSTFHAFLNLADAVEGRMREFMGTADRMIRDKHYDSRRIRHEVDETDRRWKTFYNSIKNYETALDDSIKFYKSWDECEKWISDAGLFLLGISKEAPNCRTTEDVDILIKKIETYRLEGYKEQDGRLNGMERIATDLYGQIAGPEKLQPLLDKNQEMFNAFVKAVEELAILKNNLNKTEQILAQVGAAVEKKAPRQPRFVQPLHNAEISEGQGLTFECRLECDTTSPLIEWLKDGLPTSQGTTVFKDGLCRLTLDIATLGDSATYTCKATTSAGNAETSATLKVKGAQQKVIAPAVAGQLKSADAPEGTSLTLECYLNGTPYPTVTWYKDGVALADGPDYAIAVGNNSGEPCTLRIRRLNREQHNGVYSIKAVNPGGEASSSATVTVISIVKPEFTEPLKDEVVQEGKGVRLECKYIGEPAPQIQWMFNETQILPSALFKITVDVGTTVLEIKEVFAEDCGSYAVVAKNLGGEARTSCRINLAEATLTESMAARVSARRPVRPQFVQPLEDLIVQEGNRIRLECVITGYPEPEVSWLHNGNPVRKSKDIDIFYDNGKCSLVIYEVYLEDAGEYVCVGKNENGSTQTSCRLIVEPLGDLSDASASATGDVPPKFTQLLKDIEGTEGELVRFECRVIGHPTPVIKWFRGRTQIQNSPEFQILSERELQALTIPVLNKEDAGNYMVKANNDAGQAKCYATLIVKPASDRHAMKMRLIESCHSIQTSIIEGCSAPVITRSFRDLHARPGEPCTMEVVIEGTPKPKVHWLFDNELIAAKEYQITSFGDVYALHIPAVTDKDAGRFTVIADNAAGKAWCSALLVVVEASQLADDLGSPPETPLGPEIKPVVGPMPLFAAKPAAAAPRFAEPLKNVTVDEGQPVTLECRVAGHPDPIVRWYKEGRPLIAGPGVEIRKQGDRATLTLYGVTEQDSGQYTCIAQNPSGENATSSTVIVSAANVSPFFLEKPRTQRVREGQSARFQTRVSGRPPPEVAWYREGVPIVNSADFAITNQGEYHYLDIGEVFYEDAGKFSVQANNSAGMLECTFDLSVEPSGVKKDAISPSPVVPPQFSRPLANQRAQVGQRVVLECAIPPYTQPDQVNWYRNEVFIELTPDYQQSYRDGVCQLTIPCVRPDHTGRYTCVIVLRGASNSTDMYLEVAPEERKEPEVSPPYFDDKMRSVHLSEAGHDAIFVCHLTGRPTPNIQWYHDDHLIRPSKKHEIKLTKDGVCSLRVKAATPDDAGQYTCVATNQAGQQTCHATLTVEGVGVDESSYVSQETLRRLMSSPGRLRDGDYGGVSEHYFKPVFRKVPADLEVAEGQLARFDCIVAGRPTPDVLWFRDGTEVFEDRLHKIVINEEGISSLIIDATSARDAGLYTCIARNRGGEDRFQVRLNVLPRPTTSPPRFLSRLTNQTVHVGQAVTFEAEASGVPAPMLSWQKDGNHIVGSDHYQIRTEGYRSILYISSVRTDDDAWYQCTAASVSGTATNRVRLVVQPAPRPASTSFGESHHRANVNLTVSATPPPSRSSPWQQLEGLTRVETVSRTQTISPAVVHVEATAIPAPRLLEPMRDQHLNDGAMAHFWCKIYSSVPPTCEWYHDNQPLQLSDKHRIANNPRDGDYALMVFDVRPRDAGVYKCVVSNPGGEVTCIAHLHVESLHGRLPRVEHTASATSPAVAAAEPVVVVAPEVAVSQTWSQQQQVQRTVTVSAAPAAEAPRFTRALQDVSAADGSEVTLTCVVTGRPAPTAVSWFHNGRCIDRSTDFAISYDEQTGRAELVIVDCMVDDRGQFRCVATNPSGQTETACTLTVLPPADAKLIDVDMSEEFRNATAQLQQAAAPDGTVQTAAVTDGQAPKFVQPIQPCVVIEADTCTFSAVVSGDPAPEVVWLKEKQDLVLTDRHTVSGDPATGQFTLTIRSCSAADTGVYSCRASNASGRATCTANVVVVPPNVEVTVTEKTTSIKKEKVTVIGDQETRVVENSPTFTETLLPVTEVNEGSHVRLQTRYSAEPAPNVAWRFNGVELTSNQRLSLTADEHQSTLVINGATLADTGEYVCFATNSLGEATTKTFLRVRKMEGDAIPPIPAVQPSSGLPTAADLPPTGSIPITSGSAFEVATALPKLITPVPLADPCTIISQQPPQFTLSLHNQVVNDGDWVTFAVQFDGNPKPSVQWFINGLPAVTDDNLEINVNECLGTSSLTIHSTSSVSEGEFMCKAENAVGTAFTTAHLFVVGRAYEGRRSGESTQMMISAYARPKPIYLDVASASSAATTTTLFSAKIQAEKPEPTVVRTDASHRIPVTNVFIPISVAEKRGIDVYATGKGIVSVDQKLVCLSMPTALYPFGSGQIFSETVAIDTSDHAKMYPGAASGVMEMELKKLKTSTLNVEQKAMPQGYRMIAEIGQPQTFSETISVDAGDHRPYEIELLKKKTSVMDVERKALPRGVRMEAEIMPPQQKISLVYIARSMCVEALRSHREECFLDLVDGRSAPPTFVEKLQPLTQAMDGAKVTLACRVVGLPMPEAVIWLRDGRAIRVDNPDYGRSYDPATGQAMLSINEVFPEDAGLFECVAENPYGRATTQAELLVEAYEYVADSEESYASESVSTLSITSALEALPLLSDEYAKTVAEALVEEARFFERGYEDTIQTADVKWCVPDLIVPHRTELVAEFPPEKLDATDGQQIAAEIRGAELVRPQVAGKTQARIEAQVSRFGEELIGAAPMETVDSATQQIVETREDTVAKKIVGQTFARPEAVPDVFNREPLEPLSVVCGEDRATEQMTSPIQSTATKTHPACWTFAQVETSAAEETGADVGRAPSPEKVSDADMVQYDFSRSSVGVQPTRIVPFTEYQSESEEEDLYLDATEQPRLAPPVDVEGEGLRRATIHGRQWALTSTLKAYTEPEVADGPFEDAAKPETGHESTVTSVDLEPALIGHSNPSQAAPLIELVAFDGAADFQAKLQPEKTSETEVADELCRTLRREGRPLTKVIAVVELIPQERMPITEAGRDSNLVAEVGEESTVTTNLSRAQVAAAWLVRARQQTAIVGAERTGDLNIETETENTSESVVDIDLQTKYGISGYPLAYVLGAYDRASPEKILEQDASELPLPETGSEVVIQSQLDTARILTAQPSNIEPQIRHQPADIVDNLHMDVSAETPLEQEVAPVTHTSSRHDRPVTKVMAVVELVAHERAPQGESGADIIPETSTETTVSVDMGQVVAELVQPTQVKPQIELTGSERTGELAIDDDVQTTTTTVVSSELELSKPKVSEVDVQEMPVFEEIIGPIKRDVEREAPPAWPVDSPIEPEDIEVPCECVTDLCIEDEPTSMVVSVVEDCLAKVDINELVIYLEETIIEEIVIHVKKDLLLVQFDSTNYMESEEHPIHTTVDITKTEMMSVVPVVVQDVPLCKVDVNEYEICTYSEETLIEEVVIEMRQTAVEETEAVAKSETCSTSDEETMMEEIVIETRKMFEMQEMAADSTVLDRRSYSETCSLPQTVVHHVEATARLLSPSPSVSAPQLATIEENQVVGLAVVGECTVFQEDEETYSESVCEQKFVVETRAEMSEDAWSIPVFVVPLYNVTAYDGSSATLECHVTGRPRPKITWFVDGQEIKASTDFRMSYEETTGRCSLVIGDVLPEDEGQYTVLAVNEAGRSSTTAYLTVQREKAVVSRRKESADGEAYSSGEEMYSSGEETMTTWTVENRKVFEEFRNVEIDVALRRKGVLSTEAEQQVVDYKPPEAPVFVTRLESLDVFESSPVKLECEVRGFPQPEISWYQDGKMISPDEHMKFDYSNGRCTLSIDRVGIDDEAEYICEARNAYGTASTWAELLVEKLIEGLEQMVIEEYYEVEIEMNFKWKDNAGQRPITPPKPQATIM